MIVRLLVSNDKANVKKVVLRSDTVIGRGSECNLRIASKEVSRRHCSILLTEPIIRVRDLGSANGTLLNGSQIDPNVDTPVPSGSRLEIGNVRFIVQYDTFPVGEGEASTAEVPNAVLKARLAEREAESVRADTPGGSETPGVSSRGPSPRVPTNGEQAAAAVANTLSSQPDETIRDGDPADSESVLESAVADPIERKGNRPVDDDTFAMQEADVANAEEQPRDSVPRRGVDETVVMLPEEFAFGAPDRDADTPDREADASRAPEEPLKKKGWNPFRGLFGGKSRPEPEPPAAADDDDDLEPETPFMPPLSRVANLDETVQFEPLAQESRDPQANLKTVPEFEPVSGDAVAEPLEPEHSPDELKTVPEFDPVPVASPKTPPKTPGVLETPGVFADETLSHSADDRAQDASTDDSDLQAFLRQMPQD